MSRKDVPDETVVRAARDYCAATIGDCLFVDALLAERTGQPIKVCQAAIERAHRHGVVESGVSERTCWPTPAGLALLAADAAVGGGSR